MNQQANLFNLIMIEKCLGTDTSDCEIKVQEAIIEDARKAKNN